tara:strand:- start:692 stop:982 length:291 start_codon:yes stop_codon:yes gene_type:complete
MYESMMMIIMWVMGLFGGMIYKHFQVNKLRAELKQQKAQTKYVNGLVYDYKESNKKLFNKTLKYQTYIEVEFGRQVKFINGKTYVSYLEKEEKENE